MSTSTTESNKPVLYTFGGSVWATVPELAIIELGYPKGAITKKQVNLARGENFDPEFIKINPKATLPTLQVPAEDKVYANTTDVTAYLVQHAPKPVKQGNTEFIREIHEDEYDPNFALLLARNDEELAAKATDVPKMFIANRQSVLSKISASPAAEHLRSFYTTKLAQNTPLYDIYHSTAEHHVKHAFFSQSQNHFESIKRYLKVVLPEHLKQVQQEGVFLGGSEPGEDDFHLAAWLARIAAAVGVKRSEDALQGLEKAIGGQLPDEVKLYWEAWCARESWKEVYDKGLH